jgi:hypothetical protein
MTPRKIGFGVRGYCKKKEKQETNENYKVYNHAITDNFYCWTYWILLHTTKQFE